MRLRLPALSFGLFVALATVLQLGMATRAAADPTMGEIMAAVVAVRAEIRPNARTMETLGPSRTGSGVLIGDDGLILTIGYVVMEAERIEVLTRDGARVAADFVAYDHDSGFGLLRARERLKARPVELGDSGALEKGARLLVVSVGMGMPISPVQVVSRRPFAGYWEYLLDSAIYTMPPHREYGGAALIDQSGKLVGIGSLLINDAPGPTTEGFGNMFVPVEVLKPVLSQLVKSGRGDRPVRPWLGVYSQEFDGQLIIRKLAQDGPGERAGLKLGDVILGVDGHKVTGLVEFYRMVHARGAAGSEVPLDIMSQNAADISVRQIAVKSADRHGWLRLGN